MTDPLVKGASAETPPVFDLRARFVQPDGTVLLTGVQALVRMLAEHRRVDRARGLATRTFVSGYEGSPLGGFDLLLGRESALLEANGVVFTPGVNEELAATAVWGSQHVPQRDPSIDGVIGVWYGKAPGVDRASDALRHGNLCGTDPNGGVVLLAGDDPASKSSTIPSASEAALAQLGIPVLFPASVQEVIDLGVHAVWLSRWSGCFVAMKIATDVADGFSTVELGRAPAPVFPGDQRDNSGHGRRFVTLPPHSLEAEADLRERRLPRAAAYALANGLNAVSGARSGAWVTVVAPGKTYFDVVDALSILGIAPERLKQVGVRLVKLSEVFPLAASEVRSWAEGVEELIVVEEKHAFVEDQVRAALYDLAVRPRILGRRDAAGDALLPSSGELTAATVATVLRRVLARRIDLLDAPHTVMPGAPKSQASRLPFFCSGCPHNRSTVVPEGSLVGAGIGCHGMVQMMARPTSRGYSISQMGGEGAQWIGQQPFSTASHVFQNLGDGTLFHSGSLAIRASIAAGTNITYKVLYNAAVAMTGGQAAAGARSVPELAKLLQAEGAARVLVCADDPGKYARGTDWPRGVDVWHRDRLDEAQAELRSTPGTTVLIYDQQCAAEARRLRKRGRQAEPSMRVVINTAVCEGCGDCGRKSNCLSVRPVDTEFGVKTEIHQSSCNKDYSCLDGDCPSFVSVVPNRRRSRRRQASPAGSSDRDQLPTPPATAEPSAKPTVHGPYSIFLAGIGGTGVVTVNQLMATAAVLDGLSVVGLDQTGLSQKAGPVVSHLRLDRESTGRAARVPPGGAECVLAFDLLTATDTRHLGNAHPARTVAVVATDLVPTGAMVYDHSVRLPDGAELVAALGERARALFTVDAARISEKLLDDHLTANVVILGAAYQAGALPLSEASIKEAIRANGAAVEKNLAAFQWGRVAVADPAKVAAALETRDGRSPSVQPLAVPFDSALTGEARALAETRFADLVGYQHEALARRYLARLETVASAEVRAVPGRSELTEAVARNLHKLMAYKDEYEVARLHLDPAFRERLARDFPGMKVRYHLHPPALRALGMDRKLVLGPWVVPLLHVLRALRRVRGTKFDVFGLAKLRRLERRLVEEYWALVEQSLTRLDADSYGTALAIARLPDLVKGYEEIKLAGIEVFRQKAAELSPEPQRATEVHTAG